MESYFTLRADVEATGEFVDRKSRFIAQLVHIESEEEANDFIAIRRRRAQPNERDAHARGAVR